MIISKKARNAGDAALTEAVRAWKARPRAEDRLSPDSRERILAAATGPEASLAPMHTLFTPARRVWLVGALPLLLAAAFLLLPTPAPHEGGAVAAVEAFKDGDAIVFTIANGSREHRVYKSTVPYGFDASAATLVTDGAYVDVAHQDADLVFYRID
jgi:hypothetical protein